MSRKIIPDDPLIELTKEHRNHIRETLRIEYFKHSRAIPDAPRKRGRPRTALPKDLMKLVKVWPILSRYDRKRVWTFVKRILADNKKYERGLQKLDILKGYYNA